MSFQSDLRRFAEKTNEKLEDVCIIVTMDIFSGVVRDTRVDTGRMRGNWQASIDAPALGELDVVGPGGLRNPLGHPFRNPNDDIQATVKPFALNVLTNNVPYARVYEEKDGMVIRNLTRVESALRKAVANA